MTPENFCYWLQGYFELVGPKTLDEKETKIVNDHLNLVFKKETPQYFSPNFNANYDALKEGYLMSDSGMYRTC